MKKYILCLILTLGILSCANNEKVKYYDVTGYVYGCSVSHNIFKGDMYFFKTKNGTILPLNVNSLEGTGYDISLIKYYYKKKIPLHIKYTAGNTYANIIYVVSIQELN